MVLGWAGALVFACSAVAQPLPPDAWPSVPHQPAEAQVDEITSGTKARLEQVAALMSEQRWEEAVDGLARIMEEQGDGMIPLNAPEVKDFVRFVPVRDYGHWRLNSLAADQRKALQVYRRRVDPTARRWYQEGIRDHDMGPLERIVEQYFTSSYGDDALLALGEMALERGDYAGARWHWQRLHPTLHAPSSLPFVPAASVGIALDQVNRDKPQAEIPTGPRNPPTARYGLAYPDTDIPLADLRARLILVSILEGARSRAQSELALFRRLHPDATGRWGGREVHYESELGRLLRETPSPPAEQTGGDWPTFAGHETRNRHTAHADLDVPPKPLWTVDLPPSVFAGEGQEQLTDDPHPGLASGGPAAGRQSLCHYYPIVVGNELLVNSAERVYIVDLARGKLEEMYPRSAEIAGGTRSASPRLGVPRFTMTAQGQRLVARMGSPVTTYAGHDMSREEPGYLLAWDLGTKKLILDKLVPDGPEWAFDGTPLMDRTGLYVAMRKTDARAEAHVACFDLRTQGLRWRNRIALADTLGQGVADEITHNLLTMSHGVIYFNTNLGAVAALRAADGKIRWITRYPRADVPAADQGQRPFHLVRDLSPSVYHQGVLYVAPADSDAIFALDAMTGQLIWQVNLSRDTLDAVHLLGVTGPHLIASGRRLWWLDIDTGQLSQRVAENPFPAAENPEPSGFGRGVLVGDSIYWPTRTDEVEIYVLDQRSGSLVRQPMRLDLPGATVGDLLVARGYLLVTSSNRIYAFHPSGQPSQ
jgi:outer membrane protein assembly factor BamB